jgi:purine-binding chemotaxis protein CheW
VREVLRVGSITRVPQAPPPVRGVTNLRGRVLAVVDLGVSAGGAAVEVGDDSRIVVVESQGRSIGLLVDRVDKVLDLGMSRVGEAPDDLPGGLRAAASGSHPTEDGLLLLDADRILSATDVE